MQRLRAVVWSALFVASAAFGQASVTATVETTPALTDRDAVDDPAIWIHPSDPTRNLFIGTDKQSGLFTYGMDGKTVQQIRTGGTGNVDVRYGFSLGGARVALVVANNRSTNNLDIYRVDPATRQLTNVSSGALTTAGITNYGGCLYRSATGKYYAFVTSKSGVFHQYELRDDGAGRVSITRVRQLDVGGQIEACAADDELGYLYVGEELVGIWRYGAEPDSGGARLQVDKTGSGGHLTADVEGLAIYRAGGGKGYLLASSQGNSTFVVYHREPPHAFLGRFEVRDGNGVDGVSGCDGLEVTNFSLGAGFPKGAFIAQDGSNSGANQNFKVVPWERIAAAFTPALTVDPTGFDPRQVSGNAPGPDPTAGPDAGVGGVPLPEDDDPGNHASAERLPESDGRGCSSTGKGFRGVVVFALLGLAALRRVGSPGRRRPTSAGPDPGTRVF